MVSTIITTLLAIAILPIVTAVFVATAKPGVRYIANNNFILATIVLAYQMILYAVIPGRVTCGVVDCIMMFPGELDAKTNAIIGAGIVGYSAVMCTNVALIRLSR